MFISVTGTWIAFTIVQSALAPVGAGTSERPSSATVSVDAALEQVRERYPGFEINYLRFAGGTLSVLGRLKSDPVYYGATSSNLQVDLGSGEVKGVSFVAEKPWHERMLLVFKPLHFGDYAGLPVKMLYCFFGMMPGLLSVSGFFIWRLRKHKPQEQVPGRRTILAFNPSLKAAPRMKLLKNNK